MSLKKYGVLKGKATKSLMGKLHYQVLIEDDSKNKYRIAINVMSQQHPSEVLYFVSENFKCENITELPKMKSGFTKIDKNESEIALDYIRGDLFDPSEMIPLKSTVAGPNNDLNEKIDSYIKDAIENNATVYAFGEKWGPEANKPDEYFNFQPGNGIHDIHMNQGNTGRWKKDDGRWQDGGVLIYFENTKKWVGIFLAFQSQSWCTDDDGHAIKPVSQCNHNNSNSCN